MEKRVFLILVFLFSFFSVISQNISGKIYDKESKPLEFATVILMKAADSTMVSFANSDENGLFKILVESKEKYSLQISYLGYLTKYIQVDFVGKDVQLDSILLKENVEELKSLIVEGELNPMEISKDTVNYNARAFKIKPGDVVEDLLKKMPGIEIERDGSVKAFGESVQNVLVDGKEFFGKDTKVATKNLDADAVEQVQVFDKKSDMAEFTGIEDGQDERTINLKLKEGKKAGYFGTAEMAGGSPEKFKGRINMNRFSPKNRFSIIGMANNINEQGFSMNDYMQFMGGMGALMSGGINLDMSGGGLPLGMNKNQGIQKTYAGGMNLSTQFGKKTSFDGSVFYNDFNNFLLSNIQRENFLKDASFFSQNTDNQNSGSQMANFNIRMKSKIDPFQNLIFRLNGSLGSNFFMKNFQNLNSSNTGVLINESLGNNDLKGGTYSLNPDLMYQRKFRRKGRSLVLSAKSSISDNNSKGNIDAKNSLFSDMNMITQLLQKQESTNNGIGFDVNSVFVEPVFKKQFLEFSAGISDQNNASKMDYYDIINESLVQNLALSNWFDRDYVSKKAGFKYSLNNKKLSFSTGFKYETALLKGIINQDQNLIKNTYQAFLPETYLNYEIGQSEHFNIRYNTDMNEPSLVQLQPTINNSNPLNVYIGNPNLRPEYRHNLTSSYMKYDAFNFRMIYASLRAGLTQHKINNATSIDENLLRTMQPINTSNEKSVSLRAEFSSPLKALKIKYKISGRLNYSNGISSINNNFNTTNVLGRGFNLGIENRKKEIVGISTGYRFYKSDSKYSLNPSLNQFYIENTFFVESIFSIGKNTTLKSNFDYQSYSQSFSSQKFSVPLWTASASTFLDKNKKLRLTANVFDLLNKNQGISRSSNLNYNELSQSNVLGRYFLLGLSYNIKGFKKQGGIQVNIEGE